MTAQQLIHKFNTSFGINSWPDTYEVDSDTYANVCQTLFEYNGNTFVNTQIREDGRILICLAIGPNNGVIFKNVELILK